MGHLPGRAPSIIMQSCFDVDDECVVQPSASPFSRGRSLRRERRPPRLTFPTGSNSRAMGALHSPPMVICIAHLAACHRRAGGGLTHANPSTSPSTNPSTSTSTSTSTGTHSTKIANANININIGDDEGAALLRRLSALAVPAVPLRAYRMTMRGELGAPPVVLRTKVRYNGKPHGKHHHCHKGAGGNHRRGREESEPASARARRTLSCLEEDRVVPARRRGYSGTMDENSSDSSSGFTEHF